MSEADRSSDSSDTVPGAIMDVPSPVNPATINIRKALEEELNNMRKAVNDLEETLSRIDPTEKDDVYRAFVENREAIKKAIDECEKAIIRAQKIIPNL